MNKNKGLASALLVIVLASAIVSGLLIGKLSKTVNVFPTKAVAGCGGHYHPGEHRYNNQNLPVDDGESECESAGCVWKGNGCRPPNDEGGSVCPPGTHKEVGGQYNGMCSKNVDLGVRPFFDKGAVCGQKCDSSKKCRNVEDCEEDCKDTAWNMITYICVPDNTPTPTRSPSPSPSPRPSCTPRPSHTPYPTRSPSHSPTCTPRPSRSPSPSPKPSKSPKPTKSPTSAPTFSPSPSPVSNAKLKICKINDKNNNGQIDSGEGTIGWSFVYKYQDEEHSIGTNWWKFTNRGCVTVNVPSNQWVNVRENGKDGWWQTGVYQDGAWVGNYDYNYVPLPGSEKTVIFLNHLEKSYTPSPSPTGEPNWCNGTCGSNYNCQGGFFCHDGFCRNPNCSDDTSCGCGALPTATPKAPVVVLGATAPPVLPKTGADPLALATGFVGLIGTGFWLFRKFKLV